MQKTGTNGDGKSAEATPEKPEEERRTVYSHSAQIIFV